MSHWPSLRPVAASRRRAKGVGVSDRKQLEAWLRDQPRPVVVGLAARAAARVIPTLNRDTPRFTTLALATFRAIALARVVATYPTRANDLWATAEAAEFYTHTEAADADVSTNTYSNVTYAAAAAANTANAYRENGAVLAAALVAEEAVAATVKAANAYGATAAAAAAAVNASNAAARSDPGRRPRRGALAAERSRSTPAARSRTLTSLFDGRTLASDEAEPPRARENTGASGPIGTTPGSPARHGCRSFPRRAKSWKSPSASSPTPTGSRPPPMLNSLVRDDREALAKRRTPELQKSDAVPSQGVSGHYASLARRAPRSGRQTRR